MNFFDSLIKDTENELAFCEQKFYPYSASAVWKDEGYSKVILQRDSAFEITGTGFNLVTSREVSDGVTVIGDDLASIKTDRKFSRITLVQIDGVDDEQKAYELIKKIEYVKYHCFPEGYMIRSAASSCKEAVRVSSLAVKKGIDFQKTGNLYIEKYKEIPSVKAVNVIYVTDKVVNYARLSELAQKSYSITKALNKVMNSVELDCDSCNLKALCDEVEGMRELHFQSASKM